MKILKGNRPDPKQAEESCHRQQAERSRGQLEDARAKFSSTLKEPKTGLDKRQDDSPVDSTGAGRGDGVAEKSRHRQQAERSREQLEDARAKFSSTLKEPKTGLDKRQDDSPVDSAGAGRGDGVIANSDHTRVETLAVAKGTQEAPVAHDINSIAQRIAARVLVSPPGADNPEVRIQLRESVLRGSDVRIFREGGALKIVFVASSQEAANFIASNRDDMTAALRARLPGERIEINVETRQSEHELSEHGEGRSRQQYVADDDADAPDTER